MKLDRDLVNIARGDRQTVRVRMEGDPPAAVVPTTERGAFVRLGGHGAAERKFDTLAEAGASAYDGDTIEVRGNGPFPTPPLDLGNRALTIRSGDEFRPVIALSREGVKQDAHLLRSQAALVLEGLELHSDQPWRDDESYHLVVCGGPRSGRPTAGSC